MAYGKIGTDSYLMCSQVRHDDTWYPLVNFDKKPDGSFYEFYLDTGKPDIDKITAIEAQRTLDGFTALVEKTLQDEVDRYNQENNVLFANIHTVANYINTPWYTHYDWCVEAWNWNVKVWETGRQIQVDVTTSKRSIPTQEEFLAELPKLTY